MKRLITLIVLLSGLTFSCVPDMDLVDPNKITTESFYQTEDELIGAVNGAYNILQRSGGWGRYMFYAINGKGDDFTFTFKASAGMKEVPPMCNYTITADNRIPTMVYENMYVMIYAANLAIEKIQEADQVENTALKNRLLGEAYFLRGLAYFYLTMNFGDEIPYRDQTPQSEDDYFLGPLEKGKMFDYIVANFKLAESLLPQRSVMYADPANVGRATKGSAQAFLAKAYIYKPILKWGSADNQSDWDAAKIVLKSIIDSAEYELMYNYRDNHTEQFENNKESLFEVQFYNNETGGFNDVVSEDYIEDWGQSDQSTWRQQEVGMMDAGGDNSTWWNMQPTVHLYNEFERNGTDSIIDSRYAMSMWGPDGARYQKVAGGRWTSYTSWLSGANAIHQGEWFGTRKYCGDVATTDWETGINDRLIRYSDILLMYAECLLETSDPIGAATYINMVRARSNHNLNITEDGADSRMLYAVQEGILPTVEDLIAAAPTINGVVINNLHRALRHERAVELFAEGWRFFDLLRWSVTPSHQGDNVLEPLRNKELDSEGNLLYGYSDNKNEFMPIPATELAINNKMRGNIAN
ncbi:MAG: RagB/SusD family nutrient uptake outer membrane protein [Salinivirgaceae bacterium]